MRYKPTYGDKQRESARQKNKNNEKSARLRQIDYQSKHQLSATPENVLIPSQTEARASASDRPSQ